MDTDNVKFYLKRPQSNDPTAIFAVVHYRGKPIKIPIGQSIHPDLWDMSTGNPTTDKKLIAEWKKHDPTIKIILGNISARIRKVKDLVVAYVNLSEQAGDKVSGASIKKYAAEGLGLSDRTGKKMTLNQYIDNFIMEIESGMRLTSKKQRYAWGTIKNYRGFAAQFKEFQTSRNRSYDFNDIDLRFYDDYVAFFQEKGYTPNSTGRQIKALKMIMRSAEEEGHHSNRTYTQKKFKLLTSPVDSIYLSEEEIQVLASLDLSDKPKHDLVRDVFIIGCYTALRYSDYSRIQPHHVIYENGKMVGLGMYIKKTGKKLNIPINSIARKILEKYNCTIPYTPEQVVNRYLKDIGKWAGIDAEVEVVKYRGADKIIEKVPKYQLISTHTARRSAATNMVKAGVSTELVRRLTGHSTEKNLLKYIRLSDQEISDLLRNSGFFNR